jgi:hypothetical protein
VISGSTLGLPLFNRRTTAAAAGDNLDALIGVLSDARWHTARELKIHGFDDRELRDLVEHSDGRVFAFPGSPGYKLFDFVTEEEFQQCSSLKHQAERMLARYSRYQARHHRGK